MTSSPRGRTPRNGLLVYAMHVLGLLTPGDPVPLHIDPDENFDAPLEAWTHDDLRLMIEAGQRQYDEQVAHLERTRGRAQWLFSIGLALGAVIATVGAEVFNHPRWYAVVIWFVGIATATWAFLGSAAILTVRKDFDAIVTRVLSTYESPIEERLARDYAEMLEAGDLTVNTTLTLFRQSVLWMMLGGYATLVAFLLSRS
jgi:hypothetical protein